MLLIIESTNGCDLSIAVADGRQSNMSPVKIGVIILICQFLPFKFIEHWAPSLFYF